MQGQRPEHSASFKLMAIKLLGKVGPNDLMEPMFLDHGVALLPAQTHRFACRDSL